ncbi:MAG: hypothetical protein LVQ63_07070 [Thermoplasmatales archaeon]|nr:hypothetical protein [Thermoplasmatales archaeon]
MKKLRLILILLILILTIFSSFNFALQPAVASPPATGDIAWANATASYTGVSKWQQQPTTNLKIWANNNSTASPLSLPFPSGSYMTPWMSSQRLSATYPLNNYTYNGTVDARVNGQFESDMPTNGGNAYDSLGTIWANITASGSLYSWSYRFNFKGTDLYDRPLFAPEWNVTAGSLVTKLNITLTPYDSTGFSGNSMNNPWTIWHQNIGVNEILDSRDFNSSTVVPLKDFVYGWNYAYKSISSSFSLPSNIASYTLNWTSSQRTNATYNSLTQSGAIGGHFTGSLSMTSVTFQADFMDFNQQYYSISYFLNENTTSAMDDVYGAEGYIYGISENGNFFNSTPIYFNYTVPSGASNSYSVSYKVTISNVTLTNPNAPVEDFGLINTDFTEYSVSKSGSTINIVGYVNYSSAQSTSVKFQTSELANYYPTIVSSSIGWTDTGSEAALTVNAEDVGGGYTFSSETIQVININWGDGSPLGSSAVETGAYDWTFYHYYSSPGSYTVSFQVVNRPGLAGSLSSQASGSYVITTTITTGPTDNSYLASGQKIYFNYSGAAAGLTSLTLQINGIAQFTDSFQSLLTSGTSYTPTYKGQLNVTWEWAAGNITGTVSLTYQTTIYISPQALYVLVNYTYGGVRYSNFVPWSGSPIGYNLTYSYYTWSYNLPGESTGVTIEGSTSWTFVLASPGDVTFYPANATADFHISQTDFVSITFLAKDPPQPASFQITYYPTSAIYNFFGAALSFSDLHTYVDGQLLHTDFINAQVGSTYSIKAYDLVGDLVVNTTYYVQYQTSFDDIPVAIWPITISNQNSTYELGLDVSTHGFSQPFPYIGPSGTATSGYTIWILSGSYYFNFTYVNTQTYAVYQTVPLLRTVTGPSFINIQGVTLSQLQVTQQRNAQNYTNLVEQVNITFANEYSKIYNETLGVNVNVNNVNVSVNHVLVEMLTNVSFIKSYVLNLNNTMSSDFTVTNDIIKSFQSNLTVLTTYVNNTVSYIKTLETSINQNLTIQYGIVNETLFISKQNFTALGSSIKSNFDTLVASQDFQDSLVNLTISDVRTGFTYSNDLINNTATNLIAQDNLINDTINSIKSLDIQFNSNLSLVNASISELSILSKQRSVYLNSTIANDYDSMLNNVTLVYSYVKGMNVTQLDYLAALSSAVHSIQNNVTVTNSYINDTVTRVDTYMTTIENSILDNITYSTLNVTTRINTVKNLVSLSLQDQNATLSYKLLFGTPQILNGSTYRFPVFVESLNGELANLSVTRQAAANLTLYYISGNSTHYLNFTTGSVKAGSFELYITNLNSSDANYIRGNEAIVQGKSDIGAGSVGNLAVGIAGSSQLNGATAYPGYNFNSIQGIVAFLGNLEQTTSGRALYLITGLVALVYYITVLTRKNEKKAKKK